MKALIAVFILAWFCAGARAENPAPKKISLPCKESKDYRMFDFWIGEWNVYQKDKLAGTSSVQLILDDCVIFENWTGNGGYSGKSFNVYNPAVKKWEQIWVDNQAGVLKFEGEFRNGELHYTGTTPQPDGSVVMEKLTFFPLPEKQVRQLWEQSTDGGKSWKTVFDGLYKPRTN